MSCKIDVLVREVLKKSILAFPCCMGIIFFFDSRLGGNAIFHFCNTSPARMRFFHLFNTSATRMPKIKKSGPRSHRLNASVRKTQIWKSHKIVTYHPRLRFGRIFWNAKTSTNRFKIVCNPQGIWAISVSAQVLALHNFYEIVSFEPQNIRKFTDSHFAFLLKTVHGHHRPHVGKIHHQISWHRASKAN